MWKVRFYENLLKRNKILVQHNLNALIYSYFALCLRSSKIVSLATFCLGYDKYVL